MNDLLAHLPVVPVVLPLVSAALLLLLGEERRRLRSLVSVAATAAGLVVAATILWRVDGEGAIGVYLAANWEAPFGIVLVADRLAALMLLVTAVVGLCVAIYAEARWARAGVHFHPLFQIQLMGLNGAFLTGDLFNLFVFFEVMLAASYGLQLHGSGWPRVRSSLHYVAVNLIASALFLVGLAVLYGVLGTLTMADIAAKIALVPPGDRGLLYAGAAILAMAFLIKAAVWPLNAWLVPAYAAASAPVAALFAVMTKVGVYALLRLWTLFFASGAAASPSFGRPVLLYGGLATLVFGAVGLLTTLRLDRLAGYAIIVSSGTLLAAVGVGAAPVTSAALYYLASATIAVSGLFLLVELVDRVRAGDQPQVPDVDFAPGEDTNLDDAQMPLVGRAVPISTALIGLAFMAFALVVAGLPPLSGFLGKLSLLTAVLGSEGGVHATGAGVTLAGWLIVGLLLASGFAATVSLARAGIHHLWSVGWRAGRPNVKAAEAAAVGALLLSTVMLTAFAEPVLRYARATAEELHAPARYVDTVLSTPARPRPGAAAGEEAVSP